MNENNPFLHPYDTPRGTVPFDRISLADIEEGVMEGIRLEKEEIQHIADNPAVPTFENTVEAMSLAGQVLERASTVLYNLLSAETSDELDELGGKLSPILSEAASDIMFNERLFARVKHVYDRQRAAEASVENPDGVQICADGVGKNLQGVGISLNAEQRMLLEKTYEAFERSGATLGEAGKARFKEINSRLSKLSLTFSQNLLKETNDYMLHITDRAQLAGLPESQVEQAAQTASEKGLEGWVFTLKAPSYVPFITYAADRGLRRQMFMAYNTRCTHDNAENNFEVVREIVDLRREKAQLLGYATYADYVLRRRMAGTCGAVESLLSQLVDNYLAPAREEVEAVSRCARQEMGPDFVLQPWDFGYYAHKLKLERYDIDAEMFRPYFELSRVIDGVFGLATRLYGITFCPNPDIPTYHPDVTAYEVFDADGTYLAVLYTDFHPREGKQGGAWMTGYKEQWREADGTDSRPHVSVTMNFTKPTPTKPALLTFDEVETFLHEFGHALHGIFSRCRYSALSGTNVYWDFVELPSQFMENFGMEKEFLRTFARHYETDEPIPDALVDRLQAARNFNAAYACIRQVSFGLLDMAFYTQTAPLAGDIRAFERRAKNRVQLLPAPDECCMSVQFGHIMSGGYAAGYYSYKWAEVLDADAFALFKERGIFSPEAARSFRDNILSRGGTEPPMTLYRRFRGQEPTVDALLRRDGIVPRNK